MKSLVYIIGSEHHLDRIVNWDLISLHKKLRV
jgi:hypothetical protein